MKNVIELPFEPHERVHPTEKRRAMIAPLIADSSDPGGLVFYPFLGSGTTAVVARALGGDYLGVEREERYLTMACKRLGCASD